MYGSSSKMYKIGGTIQSNDTANWLYVGFPIVHKVGSENMEIFVVRAIDEHPTKNISARLWIKHASCYWSLPTQRTTGNSSDKLS